MFIILWVTYFALLVFLIDLFVKFRDFLCCHSLAPFCFLIWVLLWMLCPVIGPLYFRVLGYIYPLVDIAQILFVRIIYNLTRTSGSCTKAA